MAAQVAFAPADAVLGLDGPGSRGVDARLVASVLAAPMMAGGAALFGYALVRFRVTIGTMV
jgi:hypothetical protein